MREKKSNRQTEASWCPSTLHTRSCLFRLTLSYKLSTMAVTVGDICKIILAVILPPLGVFAEKERCDKDVLINILLTFLGFIPGKEHPKYTQV